MKIAFDMSRSCRESHGMHLRHSTLFVELRQRGHHVQLLDEGTLFARLHKRIQASNWCDVYHTEHRHITPILLSLFTHKPVFYTQPDEVPFSHVDTLLRAVWRGLCWFAGIHTVRERLQESNLTATASLPHVYRSHLFRALPDTVRDNDIVAFLPQEPDKNFDDLLHAIAQSRESGMCLNVTLIGDSPQRERVEQLVRDLHIDRQVRFLGEQTNRQLVTLFNTHLLLFLPTLATASQRRLILESMACGCVVVSSHHEHLRSLLSENTCYTAGQVTELVSVFRTLFCDPINLEAVQVQCLSRSLRYHPAIVATDYICLYKKALPMRERRNRRKRTSCCLGALNTERKFI